MLCSLAVKRDVQENDEEAVQVKEQSILELFTQQLHYSFASHFSVSLPPPAKAALLTHSSTVCAAPECRHLVSKTAGVVLPSSASLFPKENSKARGRQKELNE